MNVITDRLRRILAIGTLPVALGVGGLTLSPSAAVCMVADDCYPLDNGDPWWDENCWDEWFPDINETLFCCNCDGTVSCVGIH